MKASVLENMRDMSVTDETFQDEMSPLNPAALENMLFMPVTCETFQPERSPSKESVSANMDSNPRCARSGT